MGVCVHVHMRVHVCVSECVCELASHPMSQMEMICLVTFSFGKPVDFST